MNLYHPSTWFFDALHETHQFSENNIIGCLTEFMKYTKIFPTNELLLRNSIIKLQSSNKNHLINSIEFKDSIILFCFENDYKNIILLLNLKEIDLKKFIIFPKFKNWTETISK